MRHRFQNVSSLVRLGPLAILLLLGGAATAVHCGSDRPAAPQERSGVRDVAGDPSEGRPEDSGDPSGVQLILSPSNPQIAQGTGQQFSLRVASRDGRVRDVTVRGVWSVSGQASGQAGPLPQPGEGGLVEIGAPGRYLVRVEYAGRRIETPMTVTAATLQSLSVSPRVPKVPRGLTQQMKATATFSDGSTQDVTALSGWSVKDVSGSGIASVSSAGLVTARQIGKATVTARYLTKISYTTMEVTPAVATSLALSPLSPSIAKGTAQRFTATATFSDGSLQDVAALADWIVTDVMGAGVASIDGSGNAFGESAGQAKVRAEYQSRSAETTLSVTPATVVSLSISPTAATVDKGATVKFIASARLSDGSTQDVTAMANWTSTDLMGIGVASIDGSGQAKGQAVGQARISASYRSALAVATLEVKPGPLPPLLGKVDLLLVIDNSPSMSPKQKALGSQIGRLMRSLQQLDIDAQVGIISTDIGTQTAPGTPWGGLGTCDTYEGDDGVMQSAACTARTTGSTEARAACTALCPDSKFVPTDGRRYIRSGRTTNVPTAMELDPMTGKMIDTGPEKALRCLGLIGDGGCGIESPLEAIKRALDGHRGENDGFLRPDALLAVLIISDEDDCSVQLSRRGENNPATRSCGAMDPEAYDCFNLDFRCFASSVQCDQSMLTPGVKTNCKERPRNYLESVDKYAAFLNTLRPAGRLVVAGIWARPSVAEGGRVEIARLSGGSASPFLNRASGTGASCSYAADPNVIGQAQLRLSTFADKIAGSLQSSICDIDNYGVALDRLVQAIKTKLGK
jgi:hypothetical protein